MAIEFDHEHAAEMLRFRRAFARADRELLAQAITNDFVWHTHLIDPTDPQPTGRVFRGVDEVMGEILRRRAAMTEVRYDDLIERAADGFVTQTFRISGTTNGQPFACDAVDLYRIVDGRVASKDTYWKQLDAFAPPH